MKRPRFRISWLSIFLIAIAASAQRASSPPQASPDDDAGAPIKVEVNVVNVLCAVRDGKGRLIPNLDKSDFELREDGKPQNILYFTRETKLPLTLGLLVDSSVSQVRLISEEREAAAAFFQQVLGKQDGAFLMSFDVNVDLLQDLTGSVDFLKRALGDIRVNGGSGGMSGPFPSSSGGGTHLYDAVYLASTDVLQKEVGRKAIILITDGQDQGSKMSKQEAIRSAQKVDTIIYGIVFVDRAFYGGYGGFGYSGDSALKNMSEETGGRVFNAKSYKELNQAFDQISNELRNQYNLGYTPSNGAHDGSYRKLDVKVSRGGLKVQARKGYYASPKG